MAKVHSGFHSGYVGKAGGLVGYRRRGEYIVRAWVPVRNPQTKGQLLVRQCFALTNHVLSKLWSAAGYKGGWHDLAMTTTPNLTARQLFIKTNSNNCFRPGVELDNVNIEYSKIIMQKAYGSIGGVVQKGTLSSDDPGIIHMAWFDNSSYNENTSSADVIRIAIYSPEEEVVVINSASRSSISHDADVSVYGIHSGQPVHVWAWAESVNIFPEAENLAFNAGRLYRHYLSDSTYFGKVTLA